MPVYEAICKKCNKYHEYYSSVAKCLETPVCCESSTQKVIMTPPMAIFDIPNWEAYESPATGRLITSKAQRQADLKASGCRPWEGLAEEKKQADRLKQYEAEKEDAAIEHAVIETWKQFPDQKKQALLSC